MNQTRTLPMQIHLVEKETETIADASLTLESGETLRGHGEARRNPHDKDVPQIGDELAMARALSQLSHLLVETAAGEISSIEHRQVRLAK
ncbi:MAG TPA: DUF1876 domain-containing protein [Actinomycetes bacterium]